MSEYIEVEQPFLAQPAAKDWTVIDQGTQLLQHAVPSWRGNFRSWWLPGVFREAVAVVSTLADGTDNGTQSLTERQLDELESQMFRKPRRTLSVAGQTVQELLLKTQTDANEAPKRLRSAGKEGEQGG